MSLRGSPTKVMPDGEAILSFRAAREEGRGRSGRAADETVGCGERLVKRRPGGRECARTGADGEGKRGVRVWPGLSVSATPAFDRIHASRTGCYPRPGLRCRSAPAPRYTP